MVITFLGGQFVKLQLGDTTIAVNPISKESKLKASRFGADIALVSLNDKDLNGVEQLEFGEKKPFVISGPGEYEVKEVFIKGFKSKSNYNGKDRFNTIYALSLDNINMCFLGAIDEDKVEAEMDDIDILFVPIGGDGVLDAARAYKLAVSLEPKVIIPVHFGEVGDKNALKTFLKEGGEDKLQPVDKLTIKKKDLEGKEGDIIVLDPSN